MDRLTNGVVGTFAWYMVWPVGHGMAYGMAWRAWHGTVGIEWYMVRPGNHRIWYMVWPGGHGMLYGIVWRAYHGI